MWTPAPATIRNMTVDETTELLYAERHLDEPVADRLAPAIDDHGLVHRERQRK